MSSSKQLQMSVTYAPSTLRQMKESEEAARKMEHSGSASGSGATAAAAATHAHPPADAPPAFAARAPLSASALSLLHTGGLLTAYIPDVEGSSCGSYYTRCIQLWFVAEQAALYWAEPGAKICRASRAIPVAQLRGLHVGKHSDVLSWSAISADPARCFSLVWAMPAPMPAAIWSRPPLSIHSNAAAASDETSELSVEAPTEAERNDWLAALDHVISASGRTVVEQPVETEPDSPDPSPSSTATGVIACPPLRKGGRTPRRSLDLLGSAVDLSSALRRERRFIVVDRDPLSSKPADQTAAPEVPSSASPACNSHAGEQLSSSAPNAQTLLQWMDVNHSAAVAAASPSCSPPTPHSPLVPLAPSLPTAVPAASPVSSDSSSNASPTGGPPPSRFSRQRTRASIFIDSRSAAAIVASASAAPASASVSASPPPASPSARNSVSTTAPKSPTASSSAAAAAAAASPQLLAPKDDPKSLEGSLNRLSQGVPFHYCAPPTDEEDGLLANAAAVAAAAAAGSTTAAASTAVAATAVAAGGDGAVAGPSVDLPGQVPSSSADSSGVASGTPAVAASPHARRPSFSDAHRSILLFYAAVSRRASGRAGGSFGQLSWCDSQTWTRRPGWKQSLHVDTAILLGKRTRNFQRPHFAHLPEGECFSIVHDDAYGGACGGVDLHAEGGWPAIRAWLTDVDRVLRSCGFAMVRVANTNAPTPSSPTHRDSAAAAASAAPAGSVGSGVHSLPLRSAPLASSCSKLLFVSQSELKPAKAWSALSNSAPAVMATAAAAGSSSTPLMLHGSSPSLSHKPPLSLAPSVSVASSAASSVGSSSGGHSSFASSSAAGSGSNTPSLAASSANSGSGAFSLSLPAAATGSTSLASSHSHMQIHSRGDSGAMLTPSPRSAGRGQRSQLAPLDRHLSVSTSSALRASSPSPPPLSPGALSSLQVLGASGGTGGGALGGAWDAAAPAGTHHGRIPSHDRDRDRDRLDLAARSKRSSNRKSNELPAIAHAHAASTTTSAAAGSGISSFPAATPFPPATVWQCNGPL